MSINVGFVNGKRLWFWYLCALLDNGAVFSVCEAFCQCRVSQPRSSKGFSPASGRDNNTKCTRQVSISNYIVLYTYNIDIIILYILCFTSSEGTT